jgi:phosphatidylglycerophosphate synthase
MILDSLTTSFIRILVLYQGIQFGIFAAYSLPIGFFGSYAVPFALVSTGFHCFTFVMLYLFRGDFVVEPSGRKLERINAANAITLFRVSTLPTILYVILASKDYAIRFELVALVAIVFATDFLDGYVSRKYKEATRAGRMLDSASDYSLLFVISIVFHYFHIIPFWFLGLLVFRLAGQFAMVGVVLAVKKRVTPKTSFLGKATIASTMVLYAFELLRFVAIITPVVYDTLEYVVGTIVALSIIDKILIMGRDLRAPTQETGGAGRLNSIADGEKHGTD